MEAEDAENVEPETKKPSSRHKPVKETVSSGRRSTIAASEIEALVKDTTSSRGRRRKPSRRALDATPMTNRRRQKRSGASRPTMKSLDSQFEEESEEAAVAQTVDEAPAEVNNSVDENRSIGDEDGEEEEEEAKQEVGGDLDPKKPTIRKEPTVSTADSVLLLQEDPQAKDQEETAAAQDTTKEAVKNETKEVNQTPVAQTYAEPASGNPFFRSFSKLLVWLIPFAIALLYFTPHDAIPFRGSWEPSGPTQAIFLFLVGALLAKLTDYGFSSNDEF